MAFQNKSGLNENSSSSSGDIETITVAYTESVLDGSSESSEYTSSSGYERSGFASTITSSTSQESDTSLFASLDKQAERESYFGYEPVWRSMSWSQGPKLHALDYFWCNLIFQLFSFLMSHLLANTPEDPIQFLSDLVDRCLQYRDRGGDPPLLFQDSHVRSVYTALDPAEDGAITYSQYLAGMSTLGLTQFNIMPDNLPKNRNVPKDLFIHEAKLALLEQLDLLLGKSQATGPSKSEADVLHRVQRTSNDDNRKSSSEGTEGKRSTESKTPTTDDQQEKTSNLYVPASENKKQTKIRFD